LRSHHSPNAKNKRKKKKKKKPQKKKEKEKKNEKRLPLWGNSLFSETRPIAPKATLPDQETKALRSPSQDGRIAACLRESLRHSDPKRGRNPLKENSRQEALQKTSTPKPSEKKHSHTLSNPTKIQEGKRTNGLNLRPILLLSRKIEKKVKGHEILPRNPQ